MPSASQLSADCPLDLDHLKRMMHGEAGLEREVLQLFLKQTSRLVAALDAALDTRPAEAGALSHTLKGSARAIGAFRVADSAAAVEAASRHGGDPAPALAALHAAVGEAQAAIEALLRRF